MMPSVDVLVIMDNSLLRYFPSGEEDDEDRWRFGIVGMPSMHLLLVVRNNRFIFVVVFV